MIVTVFASAQEVLDLLESPASEFSAEQTSSILSELARLKALAVKRGDQNEALIAWKAETVADVQCGFSDAFNMMKEGKFYEGWRQLERAEISLNGLLRHHNIESGDAHRLSYIKTMISRWQGIYPYNLFFSPEILKIRMECTICGAVVKPRSPCGHEKHHIYNGEMCCHRIVDSKILGLSLVTNPVQRYSVAFSATEDGVPVDHYDYGNLKFVLDRLRSPWDEWIAKKTTRAIPKSAISHLSPATPCPCLSGNTFGACCANKDPVVVPHLQIDFKVPPDPHLPENELLV